MPRTRGPKPRETYDRSTLKTVSVMLDDMAVRRLQVIGEGNLSVGVRRAARIAYQRLLNQPDSSNAEPDAPAGVPTTPTAAD